jgi:hypothetical protein
MEPNDTVKEIHGSYGCVTVRVGDSWKNQMLVVNVAPSTPASATGTGSNGQSSKSITNPEYFALERGASNKRSPDQSRVRSGLW